MTRPGIDSPENQPEHKQQEDQQHADRVRDAAREGVPRAREIRIEGGRIHQKACPSET